MIKMRVVTAASILKAVEPEQVFGDLKPTGGESSEELLRTTHQHYARIFHPDRDPKATAAERKKATEVMQALNVMRGRADEKLAVGTYGQATSITIKAKFTYTDVVPLAAGDICDVYSAYFTNEKGVKKRALLKIARSPRDADLLKNEMVVLTDLHSKKSKEDATFQRYLPRFIEATTVKVGSMTRPVNVLSLTKNSFTLEQIRAANPVGIEAADLAWMWRRNLEILSWVHAQGYVHGAVLPSHVMVFQSIDPKAHFGRLMDWCYAVKIGGRIKAISSAYRGFYAPEVLAKEPATPATDIYMSARCAMDLLALEHRGNVSRAPRRIIGLLKACTLARPSARYTDVHDLYAEFEAILKEAFGPPQFRAFAMPASD